jgi:hypothetical protein
MMHVKRPQELFAVILIKNVVIGVQVGQKLVQIKNTLG